MKILSSELQLKSNVLEVKDQEADMKRQELSSRKWKHCAKCNMLQRIKAQEMSK